ncbi:MAG: Arm DNA-binding domain-containing protein [Streptococcus alactolyticus]|nr:Arm DNA-binding domain-containing protein [Streptococcus alactolyticus]
MASYRKRSNGWEYRISYKNMYGKYDQLTKGSFRTKAEAVNAAAIAKKDLLDGIKENKTISLADYFGNWIEIYKKPEVDPETYTKYKFSHKVIKEYFKDAKMVDITATHYQKIFNQLGERYVKDTVKRVNSNIRQSLKVALHEGSLKKILQHWLKFTLLSNLQKKE